MADTETIKCRICGKGIVRAWTGRTPRYCGSKCKEKARRMRETRKEAASFVEARTGQEIPIGDDVSCHVCAAAPASVGEPVPLLCEGCAAP